MKVSFAKTETPVIDVQVDSINTVASPIEPGSTSHVIPETVSGTSATTAVVVATGLKVAAQPAIVFDDQNIGFEDIILPRINIVQKVGDLSEIFTPGEIVLKQSLVIYSPSKGAVAGTAPLSLTVLGFKKTQFTEKVSGGAMGILAATEADVVKNGGTLDYKEWEASVAENKANPASKPLRLFQRLATALCIVEKPEIVPDIDHIEFPYECEGKFYNLVLWSMKGTAYTHGAKAMFTARKIGHLRSGYSKQSWSLSTKVEKFGEFYAAIPIVKPGAKTSAAFQEFVLDVIGLN